MNSKRNILILVLFLITNFSLAQSKWNLTAQANVNFPRGDMGDLYKTGFGGSAGVMYNLSDNFQLNINSGYQIFNVDNSIFDGTPAEGQNIDISLNMIPVLLGVRYYFGSSNLRPYATANFGFQFATLNITAPGIEETQSDTDTGWGFGAGYLINVGDNFSFDINALYNGTSREFGKTVTTFGEGTVDEESSQSKGTWIGVNAGIIYQL